MSRPVQLTKEAQRELNEAVDWYNAQQAGFGSVFESRVMKTFAKIASNPEAHAIVFDNARSVRVKSHPHKIIYTIEPDFIAIWSVFHSSRNPAIWKRRIREQWRL